MARLNGGTCLGGWNKNGTILVGGGYPKHQILKIICVVCKSLILFLLGNKTGFNTKS